MIPKRIQRSRKRDWRMPAGTISITRPGLWGNGFKVTRVAGPPNVTDFPGAWWIETESSVYWFCDKAEALAAAVKLFRAWIDHPAQSRLKAMGAHALRGHDLACWCGLEAPCHGDVWLEIAAEAEGKN